MLQNPNDWLVDPALGRIGELLAPVNIAAMLRRTLFAGRDELRYCRAIEALYDPGDQVRVAYALSETESISPHREWPEGEICYVRLPARESQSRRGDGIQLNGCEVEAYRFPNDRRLRGLRKFSGRDSAASVWQTWLSNDEPALELKPETLRRSLLRYVPEQKWIVRLSATCHDSVAERDEKRTIAVRSANVKACQTIYSRMVALRRARKNFGSLFRVPKPVAFDAQLGLLAVRWVWGDTMLDHLRSGNAEELMDRVALGLRSLHGVQIKGLEKRFPEDDLQLSIRAAEDIAAVIPTLNAESDEVVVRLRESIPNLDPADFRTVHYDFHWNQVRGRADRLTLLDFERCAQGDAYADIATFATQMSILHHRVELGVTQAECKAWAREFLETWEQQTCQAIDLPRFRWYSAVALLTLARGVLRHLRPDWKRLVQTYVELAVGVVQQRDDLQIPA